MKKTFSKKKSAFSLIELSIVLIVIGLLIAGITGGASLIRSSELRSVMGEARGYAVAVNAFFNQFNALPGDYNTAVGAVAGVTTPASGLSVGNGDTRIQLCTTGCTSNTTDSTGSEAAIAWQQLRTIGAIDAVITFTGGATAAQTAGTHFPASRNRASGWNFDFNLISLQNVVVLTGSTSTAATINTNSLVNNATTSVGVITPSDALSIDSKIDDGVANTGRVRAVNPAGGTACAGTAAGATSGATYLVAAGANRECALSYQVDVNS